MKKNSFKRFLAVTLAAATALTFAPVSTLGLSGVVEAQAATTKIDFTASGKAVSSVDIAASGSDTSVTVNIPSGDSSDKVYYQTADNSVATAAIADVTSGTTTAEQVTSKQLTISAVNTGSTTLTVKAGSVSASLKINVLGTKATSSAKATGSSSVSLPDGSTGVEVAAVELTGENYSSTVTANKPANTGITPSVDKYNAATGTWATSTDIAATVASTPTVSADGKTAVFPITVSDASASVGGKYRVTVSGAAEGKTFTSKTVEINVVTPASTGFTYGGVLTNILAYKNASYDLAEHASVSYAAAGSNAVNLTGNELTWYLVDKNYTVNVGDQRADLKQLNIPASHGTISQGSTGSLKVTVADATQFKTDVNGAKLVAEATINGVRTVVYTSADVTVTEITGNVAPISRAISASVSASGVVDSDKKIGVLDNQIANPTQDNKYMKASQVSYPLTETTVQSGTNYDLTVVKGSGDDNPFKGSYLTLTKGIPSGTYYETAYIPFKVNGDTTNTTYIQKVDVTVSVNSGVNFRIKDGGSILTTTFANDIVAADPTVYLNLTDAKTWNIKDHIETDAADSSKVSYSFRSDSANVDVDSNGVLTAKSAGNAIIYVKATYNNITTVEKALQVRVNKNGFDTVTVTGKDGEEARVLAPKDYNNNSVSDVRTEENLVTKQIPYVQIEITGNETSNVTETPVVKSKNNAKLTYAFVNDYTSKGLNIDPATGKITIDYTKCTNGTNTAAATAMGVYAVKVVSAETNSSAATTSYYYVVVDYPDQTIRGLQDAYTVGSCADATDSHADAVELFDESKTTAKNFRTVNKTSDDFNGINYYKDDNTKAFDMTASEIIAGSTTGFEKNGIIVRAYSVGQTEHVLAYNDTDKANKSGYTAKLITVKSAAAVDNYVTKIVNKTTGETLYDSTVNATDTAKELKIDKATTIQVTLAHPVASVASGSAVGLKIKEVRSDGSSVINQDPYVTAVKNSKQVDVALYPNTKGTTVIEVGPSGHLTATDRTDIHQKSVKLAITYTGENASVTKPAKVTGVKVSNKKGAKVTVSYKKVTTAPTIKYYVQKKIGKKTSGKSVGSTKATLSVKKGATVKVRVKAYYYDANGQKHVGAYSAWKTLKTDKK